MVGAAVASLAVIAAPRTSSAADPVCAPGQVEPYEAGACLRQYRRAMMDGDLDGSERPELERCFDDAADQIVAIRQELDARLAVLPPPPVGVADPLADLRSRRAAVLEQLSITVRALRLAGPDADEHGWATTVHRLEKLAAELVVDASHLISALHGEYSITVRGGISMGAYQAGFSWYLVESLKRRADLLGLDRTVGSVTGASAGSINALLMAVEACEATTSAPGAPPGTLAVL